MKRLNRISKIALVGVIGIVLLASVGAYAFWSVQRNITGNTVASGSMTLNEGQSDFTPISLPGVMPGAAGLAKEWKVTIGAAPTSGDDLNFRVTNVQDSVSLAENVQLAFCLVTGGGEDYWLNADGSLTKIVFGENPSESYTSHLAIASAYNNKVWNNIDGASILQSGDMRHIQAYYMLPEDCASDCHDDTLTFDVTIEAAQHHS